MGGPFIVVRCEDRKEPGQVTPSYLFDGTETSSTDSEDQKADQVPGRNSLDLARQPEWAPRFKHICEQAVEKYLAGRREPETLVTAEQAAFLASLGTTPQELYDFVEDWCELGEPSFETVLDITAVRAEYFRREQNSKPASRVVNLDSVPRGGAKLGGFAWLPRIIAKARAKLRGEMPTDIMFGCRADRAFLKSVAAEPAEFLRAVWDAGNDDQHILAYVKADAQSRGGGIGSVNDLPALAERT